MRTFTLDTNLLCCENHTSLPVANFACYVCIHTLPGWSFFISAVFLNSSGTFWTRNIVHYLIQKYLTFFRSPEKLLCVDYCSFHDEPSNCMYVIMILYIKSSYRLPLIHSTWKGFRQSCPYVAFEYLRNNLDFQRLCRLSMVSKLNVE